MENKHDELVTRVDDQRLEYDTNQLKPGESIQCPDDPDTKIIKNEDGTISISKNCYSKKCFY